MTREIKFRGRHEVAGNWYYGHLYKQDSNWVITTDGYTRYVVDEKTIGQFTGLSDKFGKEVYEGDIVKAEDGIWAVEFASPWEGVVLINSVKEEMSTNFVDNWYTPEDTKVIGNIYENPEILQTYAP